MGIPVRSPAAPPLPAPESTFSIFALGRYLSELQDKSRLLDVLQGRVGMEEPKGELDERRLLQRHVDNAGKAIYNHIRAVEDAVLTGRAASLGDGLVQILVANNRVGIISDNQPPDDLAEQADRIYAALISAVRAIAMEARIPLSTLGGDLYAGTWCDPWPDVDTSSAQAEVDAEINRAVDGSGSR